MAPSREETAAAAVSKADKKAEKKAEKAEKKAEKKDKKEKKERRSETAGVHKNKDKSDKKEKKQKKEKLAQALDAHLQASAAAAASAEDAAAPAAVVDADMKDAAAPAAKKAAAPAVAKAIVRGALVEFALPLATDKYQKKVYKIVKKAAQQQALLRGVKEVNKALRKAPAAKNPEPSAASVPGVVVIAGDVNPAEVIMHLPLACEDVNAPYVFVASRGELGQAARTKRPTSVVMLKAEGRSKGKAAKADSDDEDDEDKGRSYGELYQDFVQVVQKEYTKQMRGII